MTVQDIINKIDRIGTWGWFSPEEQQVIKTELEKQVAKKPRTDDEDWLCCRNCGETFSLFDSLKKRNKYCGNCGTKIDWSEKRD